MIEVLADKKIDKLVDLIKVYGATLTGVDVKRKEITYYIDIVENETDMSLADTLQNLYKIFWTFTYGDSNDKNKMLDLKYQVIRK